jgi:hypothetical protein
MNLVVLHDLPSKESSRANPPSPIFNTSGAAWSWLNKKTGHMAIISDERIMGEKRNANATPVAPDSFHAMS